MNDGRPLTLLMMLLVCLLLPSCGQPPESYSFPPSAIDQRPDAFWGARYQEFPPAVDGGVFDPTGGMGVQRFADDLMGKRIAIFVVLGWDMLRDGPTLNNFFTPAEIGPGPGTCKARRFLITSSYSLRARKEVKTSAGEWLGDVYAVAGSVAPLHIPWPQGYRERLLKACRERSDMDMWFSAEPGQAYFAARIADAIVATARRAKQTSDLPFGLRCVGYQQGEVAVPRCQSDVRKSIASINPRAIIEIGECSETKAENCIAIQFPKVPQRITQIEDRWTLDVFFERPSLRVQNVDLHDTYLIID